jgi:putative two-component system response regulator
METSAKKRILAIDDMSVNLRTIKSILEDEYDVRVAKQVGSALLVLDSTKIDLILLDIELPGDMSGLDFLIFLKNRLTLCDIPVIMVTSSTSRDNIEEAIKRGARDYVLKGFTAEILLAKIHAILQPVILPPGKSSE